MADEVEPRPGRVLAQLYHARLNLLHVVLAKVRQTGLDCCDNRRSRHALAGATRTDQGYFGRITARALGGGGDACAQDGNVFSDAHDGRIPPGQSARNNGREKKAQSSRTSYKG